MYRLQYSSLHLAYVHSANNKLRSILVDILDIDTNLKCYIYISLFLANLIGVTTKYLARVQLTSDAIG